MFFFLLIQVTHAKLGEAASLQDEFKTILKLRLPDVMMDIESEEAMDRIYQEFSRKFVMLEYKSTYPLLSRSLLPKRV